MNTEQKRNHALDKHAASLQLQPRKPQTNAYSKNFTVSPPASDSDKVQSDRIRLCVGIRNNRGRFKR
ncbi:MAG: hypothetical protein WC856_02125 [Methylococcaceae bacterium]